MYMYMYSVPAACRYMYVYTPCILPFVLLSAVNVLLSLDETYADVVPVRENSDSPSAYM